MKRYTGQEGYVGHKFSSGDPPLRPVEGIPSRTFRVKCVCCGRDYEHSPNRYGPTTCSKKCRDEYKKLCREKEDQQFIESLLGLPREEQSDKLLRYQKGRLFPKLHTFDEMRSKVETPKPVNTVASQADESPAQADKEAKPDSPRARLDWEKLHSRPLKPHRSKTIKKTVDGKGQLKFNL